jgi:hypothetical protein
MVSGCNSYNIIIQVCSYTYDIVGTNKMNNVGHGWFSYSYYYTRTNPFSGLETTASLMELETYSRLLTIVVHTYACLYDHSSACRCDTCWSYILHLSGYSAREKEKR